MVSALSSRLFKTSPPSLENGDGMKIELESFSGYAADRDTPPLSPQGVLFDLRSEKRTRVTDESTQKKRRRVSEQNFNASNVKNDLAKAGRAYPSLVTSRSRIIPHLDMSGVKIVSSASVSASPFLYTHIPKHNSNDSLEGFATTKSLLKETSFAYNLHETSDITMDEYETSTTSSTTDPESESCVETRKEEKVTDENKANIIPNIVSYCPSTNQQNITHFAIDFKRQVTSQNEGVYNNERAQQDEGFGAISAVG
jgi:hypothetical protein